MRAVLACLCILAACRVVAQPACGPGISLSDALTPGTVTLPAGTWCYRADSGGNQQIKDLAAMSGSIRFEPGPYDGLPIDNRIAVYWFALDLRNSGRQEKTLSFSGANLGDLLLFINTNRTGWRRFHTGDYVPLEDRDGVKNTEQLLIRLAPGDSVNIRMRVAFSFNWWSGGQKFIPSIENMDEQRWLSIVNNSGAGSETSRIAFYAGIVLFSGCFCLFFFGFVRERIYLYFAIMMIALAFGRCSTLVNAIIFPHNLKLAYYVIGIIGGFADFFLVQFTRGLFHTRQHYPRYDRLLNGTAIFNVIVQEAILVIIPLVGKQVNDAYWSFSYIIDAITLLLVLLTFIFQKGVRDKRVRLLTITSMPALVVWGVGNPLDSITYISNIYGRDPGRLLTAWNLLFLPVELVCIFLLMIGFCWVLLLRYLDLRAEIVAVRHQKELQEVQLQRKASEVTVAALRSQMNPHFIFNALNNIQSYIWQSDKQKASYYLGRFSELTRTVLDNSSRECISLAQELDMLEVYLEIERSRFGMDFKAAIEVDPAADIEETEVPPMLIQPYVENAIKHGLLHVSGEKKLQIGVKQSPGEDHVEVTISDNGIGREKSHELNKTRLNHQSFATRANETRIVLFNERFGKHVTLEIIDDHHPDGSAAGTSVVIKIPNR